MNSDIIITNILVKPDSNSYNNSGHLEVQFGYTSAKYAQELQKQSWILLLLEEIEDDVSCTTAEFGVSSCWSLFLLSSDTTAN